MKGIEGEGIVHAGRRGHALALKGGIVLCSCLNLSTWEKGGDR